MEKHRKLACHRDHCAPLPAASSPSCDGEAPATQIAVLAGGSEVSMRTGHQEPLPIPVALLSGAERWISRVRRYCFFWNGSPVRDGFTLVLFRSLKASITAFVTAADSGSMPERLNSVHW